MPHLVILYTPNLDREVDMTALCRAMADAMLEVRDEDGRQVFPTGGTRVLAFPAAHCAVADGKGDYGFAYFNIRMAAGRSDATKKRAGDALLTRAQPYFESAFAKNPGGLTLQIDESPGQVYDGKFSTLHTLFNK
jgi:5-carboxymethyl-2-hydroxymuconate isomerase